MARKRKSRNRKSSRKRSSKRRSRKRKSSRKRKDVAYGAKTGRHSRKKGYRAWIQEEGSLGEGFLTKMTFTDRKAAMRKAMKSELRQHRGDYKEAYRSALGKVMALNRSSTLRRKYGKELDQIRNWFVDEYGAESSRWPTTTARAANPHRRRKNWLLNN